MSVDDLRRYARESLGEDYDKHDLDNKLKIRNAFLAERAPPGIDSPLNSIHSSARLHIHPREV